MTQTRTFSLRGIVAALCALVLALAIVPASAGTAQADQEIRGESGSCTWSLDSDGTLVIEPTNGDSGMLGDIQYNLHNAPWLKYPTAIKKVVFKDGVIANENASGMFANCASITSIDLTGLDTRITKNFRSMFMGCSNLTDLDATLLRTDEAVDMGQMFQRCSSLATLDVSKFNTPNATRMDSMFTGCTKLQSLDVSSFDTAKVTDMTGMFANCPYLSSLNVSKLDTGNVTHMDSMFEGCASLGTLDVSSFDTSKVAIMSNMFNGCSSVSRLDVSKFDTSSAIMMDGMFYGCRSLAALNLSSFDTSQVTMMAAGAIGMFGECPALRDVSLGDKFSFKGAGDRVLTTLPEANWYSATTGQAYDAMQLATTRDNIADRYGRNAPIKIDDPEPDGGPSNPDNPGNYPEKPAPSEPVGEEIPMYRLYNPNSGEHFYTASENERQSVIEAGWNDEGIGWIAPSEGAPVYRLYNSVAGEHHYTMDTQERDALVEAGWTSESVGWRSGGMTPLLREYNPNEFANNHNYTADENEHRTLVSIGWNDEGIGWYGVRWIQA